MPDDLLEFSDTSDKPKTILSRSSNSNTSSAVDDPDVYCSVASGDFEDSESLKHQLAVVEAELKAQYAINAQLQASIVQTQKSHQELVKALQDKNTRVTQDSTDLRIENDELKARISDLEKRPSSTSSSVDVETVKKQYEAKLKDVMEKARDHAKKIANERDEFRKQSEEKEVKLSQYKQLMTDTKASHESQESEARTLQSEVKKFKSKCENLQLQLSAMEAHYTTPPPLNECSIISRFQDKSGIEWIQLDHQQSISWWRSSLFTRSFIDDHPLLSALEFESLNNAIAATKSELKNKVAEFQEYKTRAESLLSSNHPLQSPPTTATPPDMETARKLMKAEEEVAKLTSSIARLNKRISQLEADEKRLRSDLVQKESEVQDQRNESQKYQSRIREVQNEKQKVLAESEAKDATISELRTKIRQLNSEKAVESLVVVQPPSDPSPKTLVAPTPFGKPAILVSNMSTQTIEDVAPPIAATNASTSYHDSVVLPLRGQIRSLIDDLESEKHQHELTKEQLFVVKEALRKVESDRTFSTDLTDATKIEYMRNVGRKFVSLVPIEVSEELEQILPVMLSLFQLSPDEVTRLITRRREQIQSSSSRLLNSLSSIPKLW
jgi:hypothetical protein